MRRRVRRGVLVLGGWTLIELMIAIAILTIVTGLAMTLPEAPVLESEDVVIRERARQWLEYEADCFARRAQPDAATVAALASLVPGGAVERLERPGRGDGVVTVRWHRPVQGGHRDGALSLEVAR